MIKYTDNTETFDMLVKTYHPPSDWPGVKVHYGAFRKRVEYCPHCEYHRKEWLVEKLVTEVCFIIDRDHGPLTPSEQEKSVVIITKCPHCEKSNIYHYTFGMLLMADFLDHEKIKEEMKRRQLK